MAIAVYIATCVILISKTVHSDNVNNSNIMKIVSNVSSKNGSDSEVHFEKRVPKITNDYIDIFSAAIELLPNGSTCKDHSSLLVHEALAQETWALRILDSSAKYPEGTLYGSYYQLGNFDECILTSNEDILKTQYCLVDVPLERHPYKKHYDDFKRPDERHQYENILHWGICVPSSCSDREIEMILNELIYNTAKFKSPGLTVAKNGCYHREDTNFTTSQIVYMTAVGISVGFVLIATIYDLYQMHRKVHQTCNGSQLTLNDVILSLSIIRSVKKFLHTKSSSETLQFICGIRIISMSFIVIGHALLFLISAPILNPIFHIDASTQIRHAMFSNSPIIVDTFLIISAFLMSKLLLLELDKRKGRINFLYVYIGRYIRLTPAYLVVIGFYATIFIRMGEGPLWKSKISLEQERCIESWWANILYINNYINTQSICMFQSWYLAVDTQLFMIAPFVIYPLWKWRKVGEMILGFLFLITAIVPFVVTYVNALDPTLLIYAPEVQDITTQPYFVHAYIKTHMRANSYIIGLIAGYVTNRIESNNQKLSRKLVWSSWILAALCGMVSMFSIIIFYLPEHENSPLESALYAVLHRICWSFFTVWMFIACATDNAGVLNKFLSWKPFIPLSRLTYCMYLVNGFIELQSYGTLQSPLYLSVYSLANITLGHLVLTLALAFVICILFESPIQNLEQILLKLDTRKHTTSKTETTNHVKRQSQTSVI